MMKTEAISHLTFHPHKNIYQPSLLLLLSKPINLPLNLQESTMKKSYRKVPI